MQTLHGLPEMALIDMGDFVGGMLKYLRGHPVPRVTIAGGVAKMTKLAQGMLDVHSKRGAADLERWRGRALEAGGERCSWRHASAAANTVAEAFQIAGAERPAARRHNGRARRGGRPPRCSSDPEIALEILVFDRERRVWSARRHRRLQNPWYRSEAPRPRNRR